jgi:hypothetical protein
VLQGASLYFLLQAEKLSVPQILSIAKREVYHLAYHIGLSLVFT